VAQVARAANAGLTLLYWNVGKHIRQDILKNKRAEYGEQILPTLSAKLVPEYGQGFSRRNLSRMIQFVEAFPDGEIVQTLSGQLSWSQFVEILYLDDKLVFDSWTTSAAVVGQTRMALDAAAHKVVLEHHGRPRWNRMQFQLGINRSGTVVDAEAKKLAARADVVVLAAGFDPGSESEGADRTFSLPPGQDELIQEIAAANKNTIVVLTSGGNVAMNAWLARVPALIEMWYPGQEGGRALAEVLFGEVNPSGRLPVTFERRWEDNPVHDSYYPAAGTKRVVYKESVFVGYRGYEKNGTKPLFPFGYGLSYTTFKYSNLDIKTIASGDTNPRYEVSFDVKNTGSNEGAEVAQVYLGDTHAKVPRPAKELKGFTKVSLRAGETRRVTVPLDGRALTYYDANRKQWRADAGDFQVLIGRSAEQIELRGKLTLATTLTIGNSLQKK